MAAKRRADRAADPGRYRAIETLSKRRFQRIAFDQCAACSQLMTVHGRSLGRLGRGQLTCSQRCRVEHRKRQADGQQIMRYGLTVSQYHSMLAAQGGVCALCGRPETQQFRGRTKRLAIDHCHAKNVVRDLLCSACNSQRVGRLEKLLNDDGVVAYLLQHQSPALERLRRTPSPHHSESATQILR